MALNGSGWRQKITEPNWEWSARKRNHRCVFQKSAPAAKAKHQGFIEDSSGKKYCPCERHFLADKSPLVSVTFNLERARTTHLCSKMQPFYWYFETCEACPCTLRPGAKTQPLAELRATRIRNRSLLKRKKL